MSRTSSLIALLTLLTLAAVGYWDHQSRLGELEARLATAERELAVLGPFTAMFGAGPPEGGAVPAPWEPVQATGEPDSGDGESPLAWCPAGEDTGAEWLEVTFPAGTVAASFRVVENLNPGALHRITTAGHPGQPEVELWSVQAVPRSGTLLETPPIGSPVLLHRLRLHLDTSAVPGWNEIDAVAAITPDGQAVWADSATASSFWKRE